MFKAYINGQPLFDLSKGIDLLDPVLTFKSGEPDTFTFTVLPDNPAYDQTGLFKPKIAVDEVDGDAIGGVFRGRIISVKTDMYGRRAIVCEGAMAYLGDVSFMSLEVGSLVSSTFSLNLGDVVTAFNSYLADSEREIDTSQASLTLTKRYWDPGENPDYSVLDILKMFASENNMTLYVTYEPADGEELAEGALIHLGVIADADIPVASQKVEYGKNMISCYQTDTIRNSFCTRCVARYKGTNVSEVADTTNNVRNTSTPMIDFYGVKEISKIYDTDDTAKLAYKAQAYANRYAKEGYEIDVQAVDRHYLDSSVAKFRMQTKVNVVHVPLGLDDTVPIQSIEYHLTAPKNNVVRCSKTGSKKLTSQIKEVTPLE